MEGRDLELLVCNAGADEVGAYERLIGAALHGDSSLFAREDGVLEAWRIVDPLLRERTAPHAYEPGSSGPSAADALLTSHRRLLAARGRRLVRAESVAATARIHGVDSKIRDEQTREVSVMTTILGLSGSLRARIVE